jgi:hypothetical protein
MLRDLKHSEKRILENQTAIMCALAVVMDFVKINVAELRVGAGLQRVRLTDAIEATRGATEAPEPGPIVMIEQLVPGSRVELQSVPFVASSMDIPPGEKVQPFAASAEPPLPCPGESGALREANANRDHLRRARGRAALEEALTREGYQPHEVTRMSSVLFGWPEDVKRRKVDNFTCCAQCDTPRVCSTMDSCGRGQ